MFAFGLLLSLSIHSLPACLLCKKNLNHKTLYDGAVVNVTR